MCLINISALSPRAEIRDNQTKHHSKSQNIDKKAKPCDTYMSVRLFCVIQFDLTNNMTKPEATAKPKRIKTVGQCSLCSFKSLARGVFQKIPRVKKTPNAPNL